MSFQTDDALRADYRVMGRSRGEVEPVTGLERQLPSKLGQAKCDAALQDIDDFVVTVRMRGVDVVRPVGPGIGTESLSGHHLPQRGFGWGR